MQKKINILIDSDVCNEIDDQFALCYALAKRNRLNILGITIAPFRIEDRQAGSLRRGYSIRDGLIDSKNEANHILRLFGIHHTPEKPFVYLGCDGFLSEGYYSSNPAVEKIISLCSSGEDFVLCCLGTLTNVAMALKLKPTIAKNLKIVWLGTGNILLEKFTDSNFVKDKQAFYEVLKSKAQFTIYPSNLARQNITSRYEFFNNTTKNDVTDFLKSLFDRFEYIKQEKEIKMIYDISPIAYILHQEKFITREMSASFFNKENAVKLPVQRKVTTVVDAPKYSFVWLDFLSAVNSVKSKGLKPQVFFTSDTHFSHERKIRLKQVPFKTVEEMNHELVRRWNATVAPNDIVYHLGDFGQYDYVKKLNGKVILVCGNYEKADYKNFAQFKQKLLELGFADVIKDGIYLDESVLGRRVYLTHKPSDHAKDCLTLFGHVHDLNLVKNFGFNVCCTYHNFAPLSETTAKRYLNFVENFADHEVFL